MIEGVRVEGVRMEGVRVEGVRVLGVTHGALEGLVARVAPHVCRER